MEGGSNDTIVAVYILKAIVLCLLHEVQQLFRGLDGGRIDAQSFRNVATNEYTVVPLCDIFYITCNLGRQNVSCTIEGRIVDIVFQIFLADNTYIPCIRDIRIVGKHVFDINQTAFCASLFDDRSLTGIAAPVRCIDHIGHIAGSEHHVQLLCFTHHDSFKFYGNADLVTNCSCNLVVILIVSSVEATVPAYQHLQLNIVKLLILVSVLVYVIVTVFFGVSRSCAILCCILRCSGCCGCRASVCAASASCQCCSRHCCGQHQC